ncbi:FAD binding domain-containing protein [Anaerobacillus arseniciselenatis]|nr:xanthine dehydrogenase family protein subunit M [Anaerobacillus arseniciselenatis]
MEVSMKTDSLQKAYKDFDFIKPNSLEEISEILAKEKGRAQIAAGCTDIIPSLRKKLISPEKMVSIKGIPGLSYVEQDEDVVRIGATTTMTDLIESDLIRENFPALLKAAENVGSRHIQNSATVVGNLCNASPAADTAPPLLVYRAALKIMNQGKEREVELRNFFLGPRKTVLVPGDIVTEIILPFPNENSKSLFIKHGKRKALEISIVSVAVNLSFDENGKITEAHISCGSVGPTPILAEKTATKLVGLKVQGDEDLAFILEAISSEISPIDDVRSTGEYRRYVTCVLTKRAILACCGKGDY